MNQPLAHAGFSRLEIIVEAAAGAFRKLGKGVLAVYRSFEVSRARSELHALSDRTLKDIGLTRGQIDSLFRYGYISRR